MADTLAEIYRNTLASSDFDSSGEATIVTTNSSTSHVIKNIQAVDTDTTLPLNATLKINDFDIVALTGNSSGSEVIAPSSTVKVKTSALPLTFADQEFQSQNNSSNYRKQTVATARSGTATSFLSNDIYDGTNSIPTNMAGVDSTLRVIGFNLEGNNNHYVSSNNANANTQAYIYSDAGGLLWNNTNNYMPKWFDGHRYVYYWRGDGNEGIYRVDTHSSSPSAVYIHNTTSNNTGTQSTYPKLFGVRDEWLFWWPQYSNNRMWSYNIAADTVQQITNTDPNNAFPNTSDGGWYAIKRGTDSYRFLVPRAQDTVRFFDWTPTTVRSSNDYSTFTDFVLNGNSQHFRQWNNHHAVVGSRLYYINNDSEKVAFIDFAPDTPTLGVIGTNQMATTNGADLSIVERTPDSSTISGRSGYPTPSLKLRVTGITST